MKKLIITAAVILFLALTCKAQTQQTYTITGTWVAPCGVTSVEVQAWGAGGGGSGGCINGVYGGAGGGGGGFAQTNNIAVTPGNTYTVTVGIGGVGGVATANGGDPGNGGDGGGSSFVGNSQSVAACGGVHGFPGNNNGSPGGGSGLETGHPAGSPGALNIGSISFAGGQGGYFITQNTAPGCGGGGGAGSSGNGSIGSIAPATAGGAGGTGSGGNGGNGGNTSTANGSAGLIFGGGGGGGGANANGGTGANGQVILTWTAPALPNITATSSASTVCSGTSTTLNASGASTYSWNTSSTSSSITVSPTSTATYTVTGTNSSGCTNTATILITVNPLPTVMVNSSTICSGTSTTITSTGASTYSWNTGSTSNPITVNPTTTKNYTVTGTDGNGCKNTAIASVMVNPLPTVTVNSTTICSGTNANLTALGASTYSWNTGSTSNPITVNPTTTTNYTVMGTDGNGCKNTAVASVTVNPLPTITVNSPTICSGINTVLTSNGAVNYSWNTGATSNPITVNPITTTNYTVTGTDGNSCKNSAIAMVTVNPLPTVIINGLSAICSGTMDTLVANASGNSPFTYNWSTLSTTDSVEVSTANTYSVTVSDANSCKNTATANVTVNPLPTVTANSPTICSGTNAVLTSAGAVNYSWNTGSTSDPITVNPTTTTNYTVTGTDGNGCTNTATASVTVNPLPTITIIGNDSVSLGHQDLLTATGGGTYLWTTGSTHDTTIVSPTTATTYSVTVTNSYGCSAIDSFKVSIKIITTGIATLTNSNSSSLYPNPASTIMNLSFLMQGSAKEAKINVEDITGKSLLETTTEISNGKTIPIDISKFSSGIYFVRITTDKTSQTIKFVKDNK